MDIGEESNVQCLICPRASLPQARTGFGLSYSPGKVGRMEKFRSQNRGRQSEWRGVVVVLVVGGWLLVVLSSRRPAGGCLGGGSCTCCFLSPQPGQQRAGGGSTPRDSSQLDSTLISNLTSFVASAQAFVCHRRQA